MSQIKLESLQQKQPVSEVARLQLKTITPVHIGGRAEIGGNRFLLTENVSVIVDEERLFEKFSERGLINQYLNQALQRESKLSSFGFISRMRPGEKEQFAKDVAAYELERYPGTPFDDISTIRPFIRNGENLAYIPGTSIKGAIRTAVLYGQLVELQKDPNRRVLFDQIIQKIRTEVSNCTPSPKRPELDDDKHTKLIEQILQDFGLQGPNKIITDGEKSLFDFMKALSISDTEPTDLVSLYLCRIQLVSEGGTSYGWHFSHRNGRPIRIHAEILPEDEVLKCDGIVDKFTVNRFQEKDASKVKSCFSNLDSVFTHMERFADDLLKFERDFFDHLYRIGKDSVIKEVRDDYDEMINSNEKPNLRLGWGSGLTGITILTLLDSPTRNELRDRIFGNPKLQGGRRRYDGIRYFPKTRRFTVCKSDNQGNTNEDKWDPILPLGWCRLEREGGS